MYAYMRRQALQEYLRGIVKITGLTMKSTVLQQFLELEQNSMNAKYESFDGSINTGNSSGSNSSSSSSNGGQRRNSD